MRIHKIKMLIISVVTIMRSVFNVIVYTSNFVDPSNCSIMMTYEVNYVFE